MIRKFDLVFIVVRRGRWSDWKAMRGCQVVLIANEVGIMVKSGAVGFC